MNTLKFETSCEGQDIQNVCATIQFAFKSMVEIQRMKTMQHTQNNQASVVADFIGTLGGIAKDLLKNANPKPNTIFAFVKDAIEHTHNTEAEEQPQEQTEQNNAETAEQAK